MTIIDPRIIRLATYNASDGLRVVFFGPITINLVPVRDLFLQLSQSQVSINHSDQCFIAPFGGVRIIARSIPNKHEFLGHTSRSSFNRMTPHGLEFEWSHTSDEWEHLASLIEPLITSPDPGHQYLAWCPPEDATVLISKGEYEDDVLTHTLSPQRTHGGA